MQYDQTSKLWLKRLLKYGGRAIQKRALQSNHRAQPDRNCQEHILEIFSYFLGEEFNRNTFERKILKKKLPSRPSAKMVIKKLYEFIYFFDNNNNNIESSSEEIKEIVDKLNSRSRFFKIKLPLKTKINELTKIKKQYYTIISDDVVNFSDFFKKLDDMGSLDLKVLDKILDSLNGHIAAERKRSAENKTQKIDLTEDLTQFFMNLGSKLAQFIEHKEYEYDKEAVNNQINEVLSDVMISKTYLSREYRASEELKKSINNCIRYCRTIDFVTKNTEQKLEYLEERKQRKAYGFKSFERILKLHKDAISNANKLLAEKGFDFQISDQLLFEYQEMLDRRNPNILKKEFFDASVKEIRKIVSEEMSKIRKKKSVFGDKKPDANSVLNSILNVLKNKLSAEEKKQLKAKFKTENIDLSEASSDLILSTLGEDLLKDNDAKQGLIKILNHRDISSKLNYKTLFIKALNEDTTAWRKLEKKITIQGQKPVKATITSTPAADFGIFTYLDEGHGQSSQERDSEHIVNMWKTEVQSNDGKVLFSAMRSGNSRGRKSSVKEIILAAAFAQYGPTKLQESSPDEVLEVKLGNIQIMSPVDKLNPISPDKDMSLKQMNMLKKIADEGPFKMYIKSKDGNGSKKVTLKLSPPILVNFGMNIQHFALGGHLVKSSYKENREAFIRLFGKDVIENLENKKIMLSSSSEVQLDDDSEVGKYLKDIDEKIANLKDENDKRELAFKKTKINNLSNQILFIWQSTKGIGDKINPTSIQTRLAVLLYLIGYPVSFNCKSGKDRTGILAAEINYLVLKMQANEGKPPEPLKELDNDEKLEIREVYRATQADQLGSVNTGVSGLKVPFGAVKARLGEVRGASGNASIDRVR